ncbi:hypothetical protein [Neorickettsia sp. 179522]|uniref:hypothetical protein n=1 Tax=Neorickettsia sp. 179522 TaxID=1714371 RepID=UPI00079B6A7B|nr:hypothetical protein [Neorickettsia sp. 179522]KYH12271.1 hypothetical protein AS219_00350 [Neorickettsia sp. 179522]
MTVEEIVAPDKSVTSDKPSRPKRPTRSRKPVFMSVLPYVLIVSPMMAAMLAFHIVARLKLKFDSSKIIMCLWVPALLTLVVAAVLDAKLLKGMHPPTDVDAFYKHENGIPRPVKDALSGIVVLCVLSVFVLVSACVFLAYHANQEITKGTPGPWVIAETVCVSAAVAVALLYLLCDTFQVSQVVYDLDYSRKLRVYTVEMNKCWASEESRAALSVS